MPKSWRPGELEVELRAVHPTAERSRLVGEEVGGPRVHAEAQAGIPGGREPGRDDPAAVHAWGRRLPRGEALGDAAVEEDVGGGDEGGDPEEPAAAGGARPRRA